MAQNSRKSEEGQNTYVKKIIMDEKNKYQKISFPNTFLGKPVGRQYGHSNSQDIPNRKIDVRAILKKSSLNDPTIRAQKFEPIKQNIQQKMDFFYLPYGQNKEYQYNEGMKLEEHGKIQQSQKAKVNSE